MMHHIYRCEKCGTYTMKEECCGEKTTSTKPARYTEKFAEYRQEARKEDLQKKGLL